MSEAHVQPIDSSEEVLNQSESEAIKSVSNQFAFFINLGLSKARDFWIKQDWQGKLLSVRWLTSSPFFICYNFLCFFEFKIALLENFQPFKVQFLLFVFNILAASLLWLRCKPALKKFAKFKSDKRKQENEKKSE